VVLDTTHSLTGQHRPHVVVTRMRITESASHSSRRDRRASSASMGGRPVCTAQLRSAITQVNQVRSLFRLISAGSIWGSPMNALGLGEFSPISTPIRTETHQPRSPDAANRDVKCPRIERDSLACPNRVHPMFS
jgi:hypothetical protein